MRRTSLNHIQFLGLFLAKFRIELFLVKPLFVIVFFVF